MPGKRYSAGAIFLQVVPVFANVQNMIEREAKNIDRALGDQMEKSGEKAGERAGKAASKAMGDELKKGTDDYAGDFETKIKGMVKKASREMDRLDLSSATGKMLKDLDEAKAKLKALGDQDFNIDFDGKKVLADVLAVKTAVDGITKGKHEINIDSNLRKVLAETKAIEEAFNKAAHDRTVHMDVTVDERKIGAFEKSIKTAMTRAADHIKGSTTKEIQNLHKELESLSKLRVGVDIGAGQLKKEVRAIELQLENLSHKSADIDAKFESGRAFAELASFAAAVERLDGKDVTIDVKTDQAQRNMFGLVKSGDQAANSFRSFNIILLASASIGPALVPVLGAIAGGLLAIGPAAAVAGFGIGAVIVGFSGLGNVLSALQARQDQQGMSAQTNAKKNESAANAIRSAQQALADAERNAARAAEDAARRVQDARESAADGIKAALESQREAQEAYRDSVLEVRDAERALAEARAAAQGTGASIKEKISDNKLAQDQALLDVFNQTVTYDSTMADGSATNAEQEQARINLEESRDRLSDLRKEAKELAKEQKKWRQEGVNGTEEVQSAQEDLNDALAAQQDAYEGVRDAAAEVDQARADGAEMVSDAIEAQNETLADNARAIEDARRNLRQARQASDEVAESMTSQQNAVNNAMAALGPAGRKFARFLFGLKEGFQEFRNDIQAAMLPSIESAIVGFLGSGNASVARSALINLADGFGKIVEALSASFQGKAWGGFFQMLADLGPKIQAAYGNAFIKFMEGLASVLTTLAPFALEFAEGFERMMNSFADWAASKEGQDSLIRLIDYVKQVGPEVLRLVEALTMALLNVMVALAPYGEMILGLITTFLEWLSSVDPKTLAAFLGTLLALITASQLAYAVMNLLLAGTALLGSTIGFAVFTTIALGLAFLYVWKHGGPLAKVIVVIAGAVIAALVAFRLWMAITKTMAAIQLGFAAATYGAAGASYAQAGASRAAYMAARLWAAGQWLLNASLYGFPLIWIIAAVVAVIAIIILLWKKNETFRKVVLKVWAAVKGAFAKAWQVIKPILKGLGHMLKWVWEKILKPVFKAIGAIVTWLWKKIFKPYLTAIWKIWSTYFKAMFWVWKNILWPVLDMIGTVLWKLFKWAFKPVLDGIKEKWDTVMHALKWVWEHILKPIWDAMKTGLEQLKEKFNTQVTNIKNIWDSLRRAIGAPIRFVIEEILNKGIIDGFNKVANFVGSTPMKHIPVPDWTYATGGIFGRRQEGSYATGGTLPGYTPGRDVHKFVSPTGGRLNLSGGEAVMRPEWTRAVGPNFVDNMNAIARSRGVNGVRQAMGFSLGGILPGAHIDEHDDYGHYAADFNVGGGYDDYGMPIHAYAAGFARAFDYGYDTSYGRGVVIDHGSFQTLYAHMSRIATAAMGKVAEGATIGFVGNYGNTGDEPTSHLHFEIGSGWNLPWTSSPGQSDGDYHASGGGHHLPHFPSWIIDVAKNPFGYIKDLVSGPIDTIKEKFGSSDMLGQIASIPVKAISGVSHKIWDSLPGPLKTVAGVAGKAFGALNDGLGAVGHGLDAITPGDGIPGFAEGGILPYNGTMKYDNGGYLPPGLTTVVNLTGKPEPVFTNDQWSNMGSGGQGGNIHYEPHFEGSDLTSEDVAGDLNFTFRRIKRGGKYEGAGQS